MSQVLCAAPLVCLQVDSGRRNISYLTPDEKLLERLRKGHGENAIACVRYFIHNVAYRISSFPRSRALGTCRFNDALRFKGPLLRRYHSLTCEPCTREIKE